MLMQAEANQSGGGLKSIFSSLVIVIALVISFLLYFFVLGDSSHFTEGGTIMPTTLLPATIWV